MRERFNECLHKIEISPIVRISEEVREIKPRYESETGRNFICFQRGEIDLPTLPKIIGEIKKALDAGLTKYPKAGGELEPKKALLRKLKEKNKIEGLGPENVVITYGGQGSLHLSFHLFKGERVAGFSPVWSVILENFVPFSGINFLEIPFNSDFSVNFELLEKTLSKSLNKVSAFYLNNPHNPTGKVFCEEELTRIAELCKKNDIFIISDEAYEDIVFDGKHTSMASLPVLKNYNNLITAFTFSKTFSMTGLRLGYAVTKNRIVAELIKKGDYTETAGVVTAIQQAANVAFSLDEEIKNRVEIFKKRRNKLYDGLKEIEGIEVVKPQGAFYFYPNFSNFIPKSLKQGERDWYIYRLFLENGIATVPGCCFSKEGHFLENLRLSISATSVEEIDEGKDRMKFLLNEEIT